MPQTGCCVPACKQIGGHKFPKDPETKKAWTEAIKRGTEKPGKVWQPGPHSVVCPSHFKDTDHISETYYGKLTLYVRDCVHFRVIL